MVNNFCKDRVVPLPSGLFTAYKWGWSYPLTNWDDPLSKEHAKYIFQSTIGFLWNQRGSILRGEGVLEDLGGDFGRGSPEIIDVFVTVSAKETILKQVPENWCWK